MAGEITSVEQLCPIPARPSLSVFHLLLLASGAVISLIHLSFSIPYHMQLKSKWTLPKS
jgi:hypothetical protein